MSEDKTETGRWGDGVTESKAREWETEKDPLRRASLSPVTPLRVTPLPVSHLSYPF